MDGIGWAVKQMLNGEKVRRAGWNGAGVFIYHVPANSYPVQTGAAKSHFGDSALVPYKAYIAMKCVDEQVVPWLCSQTDLLSNDWEIAE